MWCDVHTCSETREWLFLNNTNTGHKMRCYLSIFQRCVHFCKRKANQKYSLWLFSVIFILVLIGVRYERLRCGDKCIALRAGQDKTNIAYYKETFLIQKSIKTILMWTNVFAVTDFTKDSQYFQKNNYSCIVSSDRSLLKSADAIVFHYPDMRPWMTMPSYRSQRQLWAYFSVEPPVIIPAMGKFFEQMNWTMSYKSDSTITGGYCEMVPLSPKEKVNMANLLNKKNIAKGKTKMASAIISNCVDQARRYKIIRDLQQYVDIDVYGKCGTHCKDESVCFSSQYRFRIAFENSNCKDYVTEKYWRALMEDVIPIVNWKPLQKPSSIIPKTYINIYDFSTLKEVADYLKLLSVNETLYNEYFEWKYHHRIQGVNLLIRLCEALQRPIQAQSIISIDTFRANDTCTVWSLTEFLGRRMDRFAFNLGLL